MKRFAYVCADSGIPVPGSKGSSIHVASVCRAMAAAGLAGTVHAAQPHAADLGGLPIVQLPRPNIAADRKPGSAEVGSFLSPFTEMLAITPDTDFIYERYSLWHVGGLARARALGVPFVLEVNSPLPEEARRFRTLELPDLARGVAELLMREADGIVCVSDEVADWVRGLRGHDGSVWVVPNGVDAELFSPLATDPPRRWSKPDVPLVVFSGSFRPWHGIRDLLDAFRMVVDDHAPDAHLLCVGDGPLREEFEQQARQLGLSERVRVTGFVAHDEVPALLRGAGVAVAPYPDLEEFYFSPLKIFEFMSLGLPVVAAAIGQVPQVLPDGERGVLYRPGDTEGLARAVGRLLQDPRLARRLGAAARGWIESHATWPQRVGFILDRIRGLRGQLRAS